MKKLAIVVSLMVVGLLVLSACAAATPEVTVAPAPTEEAEPTEVMTEQPTEAMTEKAPEIPEGTLAALKVDAAPEMDGVADEDVWASTTPVTIAVAGGVNEAPKEVEIRSVYNGDMVYFVVSYADPTESWLRAPWEKQPDGSWKQLKDPDDKGGDNNLYYEDKMAMIWSIANSIPNFDKQGCFTACHAGENSELKPYGNKYTGAEGEIGDIWHWKSIRNLGQIDDQYLDWTQFDAEKAKEAGRKSDAKDSGGYVDNKSEDGKLPAFMLPADGPKDGSPGYILDSEKVPFDDAAFKPGDRIPAIVKSAFVGDRGDITAGWQWADGKWTIEFGRKLDTGSETDVQFDDLAATYFFGLAVFENAQVRHSFQAGVTPFIFLP